MFKALLFFATVLVCELPLQAVTVLPAGFSEAQIADVANGSALAIAADGRIFVCEKAGSLRVIKNDALLATPFMTLTVDTAGERGLIGVTFDPNFSTNQYLYCYYTATTPAIHNRVSRFTANGDVVLAASEVVLTDFENLTATNHNGGAMHFGPDGKLYVAVGENAVGSNSQTMANRLGKIHRMNADGSIPTDNPFYGTAAGLNRTIYALGLRNPFTFAFHRITGRLFINDVGGNGAGTTEEIDDGVAGANYGWPTTEGPFVQASFPAFTLPFHSYVSGATSECAIVGGSFYDPPLAQFPLAYQNLYFFSDYCGDWIHTVDPANALPSAFAGFATGVGSVVDLAVDRTNGTLIYYRADGIVRRISYTGSLAPYISRQPANLTVSVGQSASFCVEAGGSPAPTIAWTRNGVPIAGANGACYSLSSTVMGDSGAQFRAVVSNASGTLTSTAGVLTVTTNTQPNAVIVSPTAAALYNAGQSYFFIGTGSDVEDITLPASAYSWTLVFHHDVHTHPFLGPLTGTSGTFAIPNIGEAATNVWYRLNLTVTDSGGLSRTVSRDFYPNIVTFTVQTAPVSLSVTVDGIPALSVQSVPSVNGMLREIGAPGPQGLYTFQSWSDAGTQTHFVTATAGAVYTANFLLATPTRTPSATATRTPTPTATRTPSSSHTPSLTPSATSTASPSRTATLSATSTASPSRTATPSATSTASPSRTATPSATATVSPSGTATPSATGTVSPSLTVTGSVSSTISPSYTATPNATATASPSQTLTSSVSVTPSASPSQTASASATPSYSPSRTGTPSASATASLSPTPTLSASPSVTASSSPSPFASLTISPTITVTASPSSTSTASLTASPSSSSTRTATLTASPSLTVTLTLSSTASATPTLSRTSTQTPSPTPTLTVAGVATFTLTASPTAAVVAGGVPEVTEIQAVPQPAIGPVVSFKVQLTDPADSLELRVYSSAYHRVAVAQCQGAYTSGWNTARFDLKGLPSGLYFCRMVASQQGRSGKPSRAARMFLLR